MAEKCAADEPVGAVPVAALAALEHVGRRARLLCYLVVVDRLLRELLALLLHLQQVIL